MSQPSSLLSVLPALTIAWGWPVDAAASQPTAVASTHQPRVASSGAVSHAPALQADAEATDRAYTRDGGYIAAAAAGGAFWSWSGVQSKRRISGLAPAGMSIKLGQTFRSAVLGVGFSQFYVTNLSAKDSQPQVVPLSDVSEMTLTVRTWSLFVEAYPDSASGWNLGGAFAYTSLSTGRDNLAEPSGLSLIAEGGYDFWLAEQLALGPFVRFSMDLLRVDEGSRSTGVNAIRPALGLAVKIH